MAVLSGRAVDQVFDTFELLELILTQVDLLDLFRIQATSKRICSVINSSSRLRRRAHLEHDPTFDALHYMIPCGETNSTSPATPTLVAPYLEPLYFNPLLPLIFGFSQLSTTRLEHGWLLFSASLWPRVSDDGIRPSWRDLLLTTQRLTHLRLEPAGLFSDASHGPPFAIAPPNPAEARRLLALQSRLSYSRTTAQFVRQHRDRFAHADGVSQIPLAALRRLAAARGEASRDGWVWGRSVSFATGKKPALCEKDLKMVVVNERGIRFGDLHDVMTKARWSTWVVRGWTPFDDVQTFD